MKFLASMASRLARGLEKTRRALSNSIRSLFAGRSVDESLLSDLERTLVQADVGIEASRTLVESLRQAAKQRRISSGDDAADFLKAQLKGMWPAESRELARAATGPTVVLVTGVNGAGKTTSIAKLCHLLSERGERVILAACDTFRAGAVKQLEIWAERLGVEIIKGQQGGDPAAVAFDACRAAVARGATYLIVDTAGRLQTQDPLMRQLEKVRNVIARQIDGAPHESLLVLDATVGQNALRQAEEFKKAAGITGIVLTKMDGTARGGIVVAIRQASGVPVKFVGVGETPEDLLPFDPDRFVDALFDEPAASLAQ